MELPLFEPHRYTGFVMPKPSKLKLAPLPPSDESQVNVWHASAGNVASLKWNWPRRPASCKRWCRTMSRGKLRLNADMILRFATALEVSTDDLLQPAGPIATRKPSRKVLRRLELIETLPGRQQAALLRND